MRPLFHPSLVNGRYGDPTVYVETLFEKRSLLFDVGEIASLAPRRIRRVDQVFVSHAHIDHFVGFDHLLRLLVGHEKSVQLFGPSGFAEHVFHKLQAYCWNLVETYPCDLVFDVSELGTADSISTTRFHLRKAFAAEPSVSRKAFGGVLCDEPTHRVSAAILEHGTPCLAFALQEAAHVNVWKNRLLERGLPVGPWLLSLKKAIVERRADDHLIRINETATSDRPVPLASLRDLVTVAAGQKIAYVTDVADTPANRAAIVALIQNADILFIEAAFAGADAALANERAHLTTTAAGEIAREANVRRVEPFHFSPRYAGEQERMLAEVMAAFRHLAPDAKS
ncbi:ribonuclease Z [Bradyrhizobium sp. Rc2d]|uniref:ribonuclease Z n=1 Tax=Bradyrhizobium sp. Rc2d TaxID=1855321 RepID=UPI00087FC555|nr:MBL fold metallo-hydrolase [Bradyrhizobium sp. Rc2d]SDH34784.1 ribonuclease Z [Bradyrhizobium sp. Rc2d]